MNILLTFSRANIVNGLKPAIRFAALATLLMAVLVLVACGGGGGGGSGGGSPTINAANVTTNPVGNVNRFPDDGLVVSYTLNIASQNATSTISLNVTTGITGTCRISPAGGIRLSYNANNRATTRFDITYTGLATVGGRCVVNFAVNEEDGRTRRLSRTVTFSAERGPALAASLISNGINIPASEQAIVELTATKRDASNTPTVTFPASVVSTGTPSCTATLEGAASKQYSSSRAVATYNVKPTSFGVMSNCGTFTFNATEGSATGRTDFSRTISFVADADNDGIEDGPDNCPMKANPGQSDLNNDGAGDVCDTDSDNDTDSVFDAMDVDADGDGLIEIHTVAQLNMMRHNLAGTALTMTANGAGNSMGCGNGVSITACNGYELMTDIDLNDLAQDSTGSNWEPVGTCGSGTVCDGSTSAQFFTGMFSGNDFTISNMFIKVTTGRYGVGFFGAISPTAQLRNVHIRGGNIDRAVFILHHVGGLVGFGKAATISSSSVTLDAIIGTGNVGGLVGGGNSVIIVDSSVTLAEINGEDNSGGLVGNADNSKIYSSVATVSSIIGTSDVGGLVGDGQRATIRSSVAIVGSISGDARVGGLAGYGQQGKIISSVATVGSISGEDNVGGLVGRFNSAMMSFSVATVGSISGRDYVGGLAGDAGSATISSSVAVTNSINGTNHVSGLVGASGRVANFNSNRDPVSVTASYWDDKVRFINAMQLTSNTAGSARTTVALQTPIIFTGTDNIYTTWATPYCNPNDGAYMASAPNPLGDFIRVWDLGTSSQYPAMTCAQNLFSLADQRTAVARVVAGASPIQ